MGFLECDVDGYREDHWLDMTVGDKRTMSRAESRSLIKRVLDRRFNSDQTAFQVASCHARHDMRV